MADFSINEMQKMQKTLQDKYTHKWKPNNRLHTFSLFFTP